ncbi:ArnT family glycosyltransferase [Zavarzinella formosa]|uniref:ArnT family glycosyltransferase n=1 Tax=Zavarzinella formosa TaxID=360055 RepID=UPI0002DC40AC|nr:glycosyltransferase family 39 protein [Zavarzinella formosa]
MCPCVPDDSQEVAEAIVLTEEGPDHSSVASNPRFRWLPGLLLALTLVGSFFLKLHHLDHTALTRWDESYHAVVARNVAEHPFRPTFIDAAYLPYDHRHWGENHIWLHKPVLPFWQVAVSFKIFGIDGFSLRFPAALLGTAAAGLTYLIGRELLGRAAGFIAAALQALNPFLMTIIHGYQFADTIDISLLFWVETGMYFLVRSLRTGLWRDVCFAGMAQGLAFLSKSYPSGIVFGVALAALLLPLCRLMPPHRREQRPSFGLSRLVAFLGIAIATAAPWMIYCAAAFPKEFWHEHGEVWRHLYANVEAWGAPWDRLVFDYLPAMYGGFYAPILVSAIILAGKAFSERHTGLWLVYAWGLGVILPHLFATTKTPSMTMTAVPALFMLLGALIAEALRGRPVPLVALASVLVVGLVFPAEIREPGHGYPSSAWAIMWENLWVIGHVVVALTVAAMAASLTFIIPKRAAAGSRSWLCASVMVICGCALGWFVVEYARAAWKVTARNINDPYSVAAGEYARTQLPSNAVLLCQETKAGEHVTIMFYANRTCYPLKRGDDGEMSSRQITEAGGIPYIITPSLMPFPLVYDGGETGPKIYLRSAP